MAEYSQIIKHLEQQHPKCQEKPNFTFKLVSSFRDALTLTLTEIVGLEVLDLVVNEEAAFWRRGR